jgi:hypothetical protein
MADKFETWLRNSEKQLPDAAVCAFEDSIKCYHSDIVRPAYLLAYQGMMLYLRNIILRGQAPDGFTDAEWQKIQRDVNNENNWDAVLFDKIKTQERPAVDGHERKAPPLCMPQNVRIQFDYWRNLRNNCAHAKEDIFIKAHVLTLYAFIEQWLLKISVEGGLQLMIQKLKEYCDPTISCKNEPLEPLLTQIPNFVSGSDIKSFLEKGLHIFARSSYYSHITFAQNILRLNQPRYKYIVDMMLELVKSDESLEESLIREDPSKVLDLYQTKEEVRKFWHPISYLLGSKHIEALCYLIEAGRIPDDQLEELICAVQDSLYDRDEYLSGLPDHIITILKSVRYFQFFFDKYMSADFINNKSLLSKICYKTNFYISHLWQVQLNSEVVTQLIATLGPSTTNPYILYNRFVDELLADKSYGSKFKEIAEQNGIAIPDNWLTVIEKNQF